MCLSPNYSVINGGLLLIDFPALVVALQEMLGVDVIIITEADINCHLRLVDALEPFGIEDFSTQPVVEPPVVAIPPRATWAD